MNIRKQNMNHSRSPRRLFPRLAAGTLALLLAAGLTHHAPYLQAQPTDFNFQRTPNVRQDLRRYFDEADKKKEAADWQRIIESGRRLAAAEWELNADREIEQRLKDAPTDQKESLRLQYESEKEVARFAWELEVDRGIDERRGQWRARLASEPLLPILDTIKVDDLIAAVMAADQLRFDDTQDLNTRIAAFDATTNVVTVLRADFETALDAEIANVRGTGAALTGDERTAFLKELDAVEKEYQDIYKNQEYQIVGKSRASFIRRENQNLDLNANINNETDPARLVQLLIERVERNIDPVTGELIRPDGNGGNLIVGFDGGGNDLETRIAAALENGRKQWQTAIDDLIVQKLKFDRETADGRREGENKWGRAYEQLLEARTTWNNTINARIQAGLAQWDTQEARLQENKRKALDQLEKFIATERDAGKEHVRGLEQMVVGGSDTLGSIVENQRWFTDKISEIDNTEKQRPLTWSEDNRRNVYRAQLTYWQSLEARFRQVVVDAQDVVHDKTMLGNGNGVGLLQAGGDNQVLTTAEFELRIARKEQEILQRKLDRAQAVYDYAIANVKDSPADIETRLNTAKTAYDNSEQCYLKNLAELNGGDASVYTCATTGGAGLLSALDTANKTLEEKRTALEKAREEMDLAKQVYDQVRKLQVLAQNPHITTFAGEPGIQQNPDGTTEPINSLGDEVTAIVNQLGTVREKIRQNEQKVFSILYEKQNAVRSLNFYHDVSTRVKDFEESKEKFALLNGLLTGAADLDAQFTAVLAGDTLVKLYGNATAAAIRAQLTALQGELTNRDAPVVTKLDELAPLPGALQAKSDALKAALAADAGTMTAFIDGFDALLAGLRANRPDDATTHDALGTLATDYRTLLGERAVQVSEYDTAATALAAAVTDYQTWTAANAAKKGDPDYQARVRALNQAVVEYRIAAAKLDEYRARLRSGYANLNALGRGALTDLNKYADALTDRTQREAMLKASGDIATAFSPAADAMDAALAAWETPIQETAKALGEYEIAFGALGTALDARNALLARGADAMNSMLDALDQDRKARQAEMSFLLDETGTTASLDGLVNTLSSEVKTKGAAFNESAMRYLAGLFPGGAGAADRDPAVIIQTLRDDVNARLAANSNDPAVKRETAMRRAVLEYLVRNQAAIAATVSDDTEYGDFVTALGEQVTAATELASFYTNLATQPNGELPAAEIARIKASGTTAEQRNLTDYFRYGSAFLFNEATQIELGGDARRTARVKDFAERVKRGEILTVLADAKFQGQEAGGLLGEIKTYLAANGIAPADLAKLTAQQLYDDANIKPANLVEDTTETARLKTELANLLATGADDEAKLRELLKPANLAKLDEIFGDSAARVHAELQTLVVRLDGARAEEQKQNAILLAGLANAGTVIPPLLTELDDAKKTDFLNLKTVLDGFAVLPNLEDPDSPKFKDVPRLDGGGNPVLDGGGNPIIDQVPDGFEKPFESFDLTELTAATTEYQGKLDEWAAKRDAFADAYNAFNTANAALNAHKTANPGDTTSTTYLNLVADVVAKSDTMRTAYDDQKKHRSEMQAALVNANTAGLAILLQVNLVFPGLAAVELIPEAAYTAMTQAEKDAIDADPVAYRVVGSGDNALMRALADIRFGHADAGRKVQTRATAYALADQSVQQRMTMLGVTAPAIAAAKTAQTDALTDISAKIAGLDGRVIVYEDNGSGAINGQLVRDTVEKIGRFLLEKAFKGETYNTALNDILAEAKQLTDEMGQLEFLKSHRAFAALAANDTTAIASELTLSNTELERAKTKSELYAAGETLLGEMRGLMQSMKAGGRSIIEAGGQVENLLVKYNELKAKAGSEFTFAPGLETAMNGLTEQWWRVRRAGLVQAFLSERADQRSVDVFLNDLKQGRFYLYDQNGRPAEQKADFLGAPLTNARLDELGRELELYNAKSILSNAGIQKDLADFLDKQDPTLRAELGAYALEDAYRKFSTASDIGYVPHTEMPTELRDFALAESFTRYLRGRDDLDENIAGDRATARAGFLLAAGPFDAGDIAKLDAFLAAYDSRNASFYLPAELKELHAKERYFQLSETSSLTPGDLTALGQWLADEKYEAGVTGAVADVSRIDYILRNYYGETGGDAETFRTNIDADLAGKTGTGLSNAELQAYMLTAAGAGDALGYYMFEPGSLLTSELYLNSFEYDTGLDSLADTLDAEHIRFLHAANDARSEEGKIAYVNKALQGLFKMESYRDYLDIGVGGIEEKSYQVRVQNRLLELEQQAERKLGGLLSTLGYESFAFKTGPDPTDPAQDFSTYLSLGKTIEALKGAYTIQDTAHNKTAGVFDFQGDLDNVRTRVESYLNAVQPDFGAANNPTVNLGQAQGRFAALTQSIIDTGHIAMQYQMFRNPDGSVNTAAAANVANDLNSVASLFETRKNAFDAAKTQYDTAADAARDARQAYDNKQTTVSTAYADVEAKDKVLGVEKAVHDFAQVWARAADADDPQSLRDDLVLDAKTRLDAAKAALDAKNKEIASIQEKLAKQATLAELDAEVSANKAKMVEWAQRAMRFSRAEERIKNRVRILKEEIATLKSGLAAPLNNYLPLNDAPHLYSDLDGYLDVGSSTYIQSEDRLRDQYRMLNGIVDGRVGVWDFMTAKTDQIDPDDGSRIWGRGLADMYSEYNLAKYFRDHNGGHIPGAVWNAIRTTADIWILDREKKRIPIQERQPDGKMKTVGYRYQWGGNAQAVIASRERDAHQYYGGYRAAMDFHVGRIVAEQAVIFRYMGVYGIAPAALYINAVNTANAERGNLENQINDMRAKGLELRNKHAELQALTDIDTVGELKAVLARAEFGLRTEDVNMITTGTCTGTCGLDKLVWKGGDKDLAFKDIAGSDGKSIAHLKGRKDSFGFYVRKGKAEAGAIGSLHHVFGSDGRSMQLMVSADEFSDALAAMAKTQYEIQKSEYHAKAKNFINANGVKADQLTILTDRENFMHGLLKQAANLDGVPNSGVGYEMYRTIAQDYMGDGKVVDQILELRLKQQVELQKKDWQAKEEDFAAKKAEWLETMKRWQDGGVDQWAAMEARLKKAWQAWRDDYDKQAKIASDARLKRIEDAVRAQRKWTEDMLRNKQGQSDAERIKALYEGIQAQVEGLKRGLPARVASKIDVNSILNAAWAKEKNARRELDLKVLQGALYADVNLFLTEARATNFETTESERIKKEFETLQDNLRDASTRMAMLQTLDTLVTLPDQYEKTIAEANKQLDTELENRVRKSGFFRKGDVFTRFTQTPNSMARGLPGEWQIIPAYRFYQYAKPDLPKVKDSKGREWNLANLIQSSDSTRTVLSFDGRLDPVDLEVMVKLAQSKMDKDFKEIYDPENPQDLETAAIAACGLRCFTRAAQATQASIQNTASDFGTQLQQLNSGQTQHQLGQSALKAGYIVGDVEGGKFGEHHFHEFWNALQLKDYYDKLKGEAEARQSSGHFAVGKGLGKLAVSGLAMTLGPAGPLLAAGALGSGDLNALSLRAGESMYRNRDAIDQTVNVSVAVAAAVGAAFSGGATAAIYAGYAAAAYKASIGAYEGGAAGALAGAATGILAGYAAAGELGGLSLDLNYTYAEGWGASVGYGWDSGASLALNYNETEGFGVSGGIGLGGLGRPFQNLGLNVGVNQSGGYSAGLNIGRLGSGGRNSLNLGYRYSQFSGGTTSLSYTSGNLMSEDFSTTGGFNFNTNDGFGLSAGVGWVSQAGNEWRTNNFSLGVNKKGINASYSSRGRGRSPIGGNQGQRNQELTNILAAVADPRLRQGMLAEGLITAEQLGWALDADGEGEGIMGLAQEGEFTSGGIGAYDGPDTNWAIAGADDTRRFNSTNATNEAQALAMSLYGSKAAGPAMWRKLNEALKSGGTQQDIMQAVYDEFGDVDYVDRGIIGRNMRVMKSKHDAYRASLAAADEQKLQGDLKKFREVAEFMSRYRTRKGPAEKRAAAVRMFGEQTVSAYENGFYDGADAGQNWANFKQGLQRFAQDQNLSYRRLGAGIKTVYQYATGQADGGFMEQYGVNTQMLDYEQQALTAYRADQDVQQARAAYERTGNAAYMVGMEYGIAAQHRAASLAGHAGVFAVEAVATMGVGKVVTTAGNAVRGVMNSFRTIGEAAFEHAARSIARSGTTHSVYHEVSVGVGRYTRRTAFGQDIYSSPERGNVFSTIHKDGCSVACVRSRLDDLKNAGIDVPFGGSMDNLLDDFGRYLNKTPEEIRAIMADPDAGLKLSQWAGYLNNYKKLKQLDDVNIVFRETEVTTREMRKMLENGPIITNIRDGENFHALIVDRIRRGRDGIEYVDIRDPDRARFFRNNSLGSYSMRLSDFKKLRRPLLQKAQIKTEVPDGTLSVGDTEWDDPRTVLQIYSNRPWWTRPR